jgi:nitrate/TMAO reductase-like tetraheme cytochrome c subunit
LGWFKELYHSWLDVLTLPGRLLMRGWRWFIGMGFRRAMFFVLSAVVMTIVVLTVFVKATSQPQFCVSCHIMQPYFDAWKTSKHNDVQCIKCHIEPGIQGTIKGKFVAVSMLVNYATGLYKRSKPWAEISDVSCLQGGCHETRLLQGVEDFKGVRFDHRPHLTEIRRGSKLRCTSCHANIVQGSHISVSESTCFLCHLMPDTTGQMTELAECKKCHTPPQGEAAIATFDHADVLAKNVDCRSCHATDFSGDGYVPPVRCNNCHAELQHIERYNETVFIHQMHVSDHKVECEECHLPIRHGVEARKLTTGELRCGQCHGGGEDAMDKVWAGELPGIPATPPLMQRIGMTCNSCHIEPIHLENGTYATPDCKRCHDPGYERLWKNWKEPIEKALVRMESALDSLDAATRDTLSHAIKIYRAGNPVHNPDLLAPLGRRILGEQTNARAAECMVCHPSPADLNPIWNGLRVNHSKHADQGLGCRKCHDPDGEPHGKLLLTRSECSACHHGPFGTQKGECKSCHQTQANTFSGRVKGYVKESPAAMFDAEVGCTDCHEVKGNHVSRNVGPACVKCHDDGYAATLLQWQQFGDSLLTACDDQMSKQLPGSDEFKKFSDLANALRSDRSRAVHNPELFEEWKSKLNAVQ